MTKPRIERIGDCTLYLGDCTEILPAIQADAVVTDPPYGVTDHEWDRTVPAAQWMVAPSVVFAAEPFATALINEAPIQFKYDLVWAKNTASNTLNCKIRPARMHERVLVFGSLPYTPQKRQRTWLEMSRLNMEQRETMGMANPGSVLWFDSVNNRNTDRTEHPSQKPVELMRWLIASYTLPGSCVVDPFMGSASTGVACVAEGRRFIGIEQAPQFFEIACEQVSAAYKQQRLFA